MNLTPHSVSYRHKGREYVIEVYAENPRDAQDRIRSAYFNGEAHAVVLRGKIPSFLGNLIGGKQ